MRHKKVQKRQIKPDAIYGSLLVAKFINNIMQDGKKTVAQSIVYGAFDSIKEKGLDPLESFEKAIQNVAPKQEVIARRVGGASYQVPQPVKAERRISLAMRWIIEAATKRSSKEYHSFKEKLAAEINAVLNNEGEAIRKRDIMHKQAEANRAFSHFRF